MNINDIFTNKLNDKIQNKKRISESEIRDIEKLDEVPIEMHSDDPMDPTIYGHGRANPARLKDRMLRAQGQLTDLARRAQTASPSEWQRIAKNFEELKMNIEQISHALDELAAMRRRGGIRSRGIDPAISEGAVKQTMHTDAERMDLKQFLDRYALGKDDTEWMTAFWKNVNGEEIDEGAVKQTMHTDAERMDLKQFLDRYALGKDDTEWMTAFWKNVNGEEIDEDRYERDQQRQMDDKRAFKRAELEYELGHEDDPQWQKMMRERDRGPWYLSINGKIYKQKGEPKSFDWKSGATKYAQAILKNRPELQGKIFLTKNKL